MVGNVQEGIQTGHFESVLFKQGFSTWILFHYENVESKKH